MKCNATKMQRRALGNKGAARTQPATTTRKAVEQVAGGVKKKESEVIKAASKAEETLERIKQDEAKEVERVRAATEQKLTGGEVNWLQYLRPVDARDTEECAKMDEFNYSVFQHNVAMVPRINELMKALGKQLIRADPPPKYLAGARAKYEEMLFNDEFRVLKGIEFLAKRNIFPVKDYEMIEASKLADDLAEKEEIARLIGGGTNMIDISPAVGTTHKANCTCENRWDGVSERCVGESVRIRWRRMKDHHFLRPRIVPEKY